uniref:Copper transport protein n=1 Tax=Salix viminalis TaxID=40686 RepID=A0A6N2KKC9_SALVM
MSQGHDHDSMNPGSMNMSPSDMMMHTSFYWGKDAIILFSGWPNGSLGMYILALFCVFLVAAAIEIFSAPEIPEWVRLFKACVYAVRAGLAYMVMLAVMSFNLGIFFAALGGHATGFFLVKVRAPANQNQTASKFTLI